MWHLWYDASDVALPIWHLWYDTSNMSPLIWHLQYETFDVISLWRDASDITTQIWHLLPHPSWSPSKIRFWSPSKCPQEYRSRSTFWSNLKPKLCRNTFGAILPEHFWSNSGKNSSFQPGCNSSWWYDNSNMISLKWDLCYDTPDMRTLMWHP